MDEDLVVLLVPGVHLVPVQRQVAADVGAAGQRVGVAPDGVLGDPVADRHRPVGRVALERAVGPPAGRCQQVHADVGDGDVVDRQVLGLEQQQGSGGVHQRHTAEHGPDPPGGRLDPDAGGAGRPVRKLDRLVFEGFGHGGLLMLGRRSPRGYARQRHGSCACPETGTGPSGPSRTDPGRASPRSRPCRSCGPHHGPGHRVGQ